MSSNAWRISLAHKAAQHREGSSRCQPAEQRRVLVHRGQREGKHNDHHHHGIIPGGSQKSAGLLGGGPPNSFGGFYLSLFTCVAFLGWS